ncbi:MAG: phosphopantetheine-binding protein [Acidobacteriota bacterium]|jgi:acyl carrier protein
MAGQNASLAGEIMSDAVAQKVLAAIAQMKKIPPETIALDSSLEELRIDSLDGLNLFFDLEEAFDISIPDEAAKKMQSVRQIVEGLDQLIANKNAPNPLAANQD